jgi:hypothetical protein
MSDVKKNPSMLVFYVAAFVGGLYILCRIKLHAQDDEDEHDYEEEFFEELGKEESDLQLRVNNMSDADVVKFIRNRILRVDERAIRAVQFVPGTFSETVNKTIIRICVRNPRTKTVYPINTLVHVALHELCHTMMSDFDFDHSERFFRNLEPLVNRAISLGIYDEEEGVVDDYMESCARKG